MGNRKRFYILAIASFAISLAIYVFTYCLFHYLGPDGFSSMYRDIPYKPVVTIYFGIWGVMFQFAALVSVLLAWIFCPNERKQEGFVPQQ